MSLSNFDWTEREGVVDRLCFFRFLNSHKRWEFSLSFFQLPIFLFALVFAFWSINQAPHRDMAMTSLNRKCAAVSFLLLIISCFSRIFDGVSAADIQDYSAPVPGGRVCPCKDSSLCQPIQSSSRKEVYGFAVLNDSNTYLNYDWTKLTTVSFCFRLCF